MVRSHADFFTTGTGVGVGTRIGVGADGSSSISAGGGDDGFAEALVGAAVAPVDAGGADGVDGVDGADTEAGVDDPDPERWAPLEGAANDWTAAGAVAGNAENGAAGRLPVA
jgi:hypothetical protein